MSDAADRIARHNSVRTWEPQWPALCTSGVCRPDDHGGPRRAAFHSHICDTCADHLQQQMTGIADAWPDLQERLGTEQQPGREKVTGSKDPGLILNEATSDVMRAVTDWTWFLARALLDEKDVRVKDQDTPSLLAWLATWHLPWLTHLPDQAMQTAVCEEGRELARRVKRVAYPSGARRVDIPSLRCVEHTTTDQGERVPCEGTMFVIVQPGIDMEMPDMVCTVDETHTVDPATWQRRGFRAAKLNEDASRELWRALTGT